MSVGTLSFGELLRGHRLREQLFHNGIACFERWDQLTGMVTTKQQQHNHNHRHQMQHQQQHRQHEHLQFRDKLILPTI